MKKVLSICLLFCLLVSSAGVQAMALETRPVAVLKAQAIEMPPAVQDLPDAWVLESSDDEVLGNIEKQIFHGVAAPPEQFALACQFQPDLAIGSARPQGASHRVPLYILLGSYRS